MQYYLFIFFDVGIMHYLHEDKMKKDECISKAVPIYLSHRLYMVHTKDTQSFD